MSKQEKRFRRGFKREYSRGEEPIPRTHDQTSTGAIAGDLWSRKQALQLFGGSMAGVALGLNLTAPDARAQAVNPIVTENQQQGTDNWFLDRTGFKKADDVNAQIQGYASAPSVNKGQSIDFRITTNPPQQYSIDVYRIGWYGGLGARLMKSVGPLDGVSQPAPALDANTGLVDCNWSVGYTLDVPDTWTSGVYLALLSNQQNYQSYIVFVVRDDARTADILYQQPVTTYQAYNNYPDDGRIGKSLYDFNSYGSNTTATGSKRAAKVSFDRPYTDGHGAGQFVYSWDWELHFVRWLEKNGYDVAYSTSLDTHTNGSRLLNYKGFVSVGHDEYWSKRMYDAAETARDSGMNLGFFGSNGVHWQVRFESSARGVSDRVQVCYKTARLDPVQGPTTTVKWRDPVLNRPEQGIMGVQYTNVLQNNGQGAKFVVNNSDHWVYNGTGFVDGDQVPGIVGYETDRYMSEYPTPKNTEYTILSHSPVTATTGASDFTDSSIYKAPSGAWVYSTGSNHWAYGLDQDGVTDARIQLTTSNILDAFANSTAPSAEVAPGAPSDLVAVEMSSSRIDLRWKDNATNETAYTVERSPDGSTGWIVVTDVLDADTTSYSDTGLSPNTPYYYRVRATNGTNVSDYSNVASDTTAGETTVVFSDDFTGADGAAWNATKWATNVGTSALTDIQSNQGRMRYENVANARALATAKGGKAADAEALMSFRFASTSPRGFLYVFLRGSGDWVGTWPSNSYFLQIQNDSNIVNMWKSTSGGTTTQLSSQKIGQMTTAKQWVRFKVQGNNIKVKVWTDGTPEPVNWEMEITDSTITGAGVLQLKWLRGGVATSAGEVFIDDVQVTAAGTQVVPRAPSDLTATAISNSRIDLTWTDNANFETGYTVERSPDGSTGWTVVTSTLLANTTSYSDTGLEPDTPYYYRVRATNGTNVSDYSNVAGAATDTSASSVVAFSDNFTGADGAAWNATKWATNVGTSALTDIQSNQGRMRYENVANARALATASMPKSADAEALMSFRFASTSPRGFLYVFLRGSGDWVGTWPSNSYFLQIQNDGSGYVNVWKSTPGATTTQLSSQKIGQMTTAKQWVRFRVQGNNIKVKVWTDGTNEPTTWETALTDSTITGAGVLQLKWLRGGVATSAGEVFIDDVQVTTYQAEA